MWTAEEEIWRSFVFILPTKSTLIHRIVQALKRVYFFGYAFLQPMLCPLPQTALSSTGVSPSSGLPGDALNSVVEPRFSGDPLLLTPKEPSIVGFLGSLGKKNSKTQILVIV